MKTKILFLLFFMSLVSLKASAQIENEIKNFVDSTEILLNNSRKYLSQCLNDNKIEKSNEVFLFIMMKGEEKNCSSLDFKEQLLLLTIFKNWDAVLQKMGNYSIENEYACLQNPISIDDVIFKSLKINKDKIQEDLNKQDFNAEKKQILEILLHVINYGTKNDEYDALIKSFRKSYPNSAYITFVKNYLPEPKYKVSISYSTGPKFSFYTGKLAEHFKNPTGMSLSMDFNFSNVFVSLYVEGASNTLKKDVIMANKYNEIHSFKPGDKFSRTDVGFKTGYFVVRNKYFHFAPYASLLSGGYMNSNLYVNDANDSKEFSIYDSFNLGGGASFELKLKQYKSKTLSPYYMYGLPNENIGYFGLKLDAGFVAIPKFDLTSAKGNMAYITLGLVWGIGEF